MFRRRYIIIELITIILIIINISIIARAYLKRTGELSINLSVLKKLSDAFTEYYETYSLYPSEDAIYDKESFINTLSPYLQTKRFPFEFKSYKEENGKFSLLVEIGDKAFEINPEEIR